MRSWKLQNSYSAFPGLLLGQCFPWLLWVAWNKHNSCFEGTFLLGFLSNLPKAGNTESVPLAGDGKELNHLQSQVKITESQNDLGWKGP